MRPVHLGAVLKRTTDRWDPWLVCAALLAVIPIQSIVQPGMPHTADGQVHLLRTLEVTRLLRAGVFYPRWAPDFYLGYGYPFFNFYAAGAHLLAGWLALAGLGVVKGIVAVEAGALLLYPTGAYLAIRSLWAGRREPDAAAPVALAGAALYLYAPLRWRELFVQGNLSQLLALAWLPWCAWLLSEAVRLGSRRRAVAAGIGLAALLYAHHPSAFLAFPALAAYALALGISRAEGWQPRPVRAAWHRLWARIWPVVLAFVLALALAAPFWLPALAEMRYVNFNAIDTGSFNAVQNLLPLSELMAPPAIQDGAALNPPMPNSLGVAQAILAVPGLLAAVWLLARRRGQGGAAGERTPDEPGLTAAQLGRSLLVVALLLLASLVLMLPLAAPFWRAVPLARLIAFPWRLLGPALLWAALLGSAWLGLLPPRPRLGVMAVLLVLIPLGVAPYLFPRPFARVEEPQPGAITRYELAGGAAGTASANEYLPLWVADGNPPPRLAQDLLAGRTPQRVDARQLPAGSKLVTLSATGLDDRYALDLPQAASVQFLSFYFPGWQATVDGRAVGITASRPYGLIEVAVPAGSHELRLVFGSTPVRTAAAWAFAAGLAACAALWVGLRRAPAPAAGPAASARRRPGYRLALAPCLVILLVAGLKIGVVGPGTAWFRQQSPAQTPAAMQHPVRARFANGVELLGYDLPASQVRQGEALAVRLYWRPLKPNAANARPFIHLDAITGEVTWADQTKLNAGDKPMTSWVGGFFVVDDYQIPVPANTPPVLARLRAGLLGGDGELVPLADGSDLANLGTVHILPARPAAAGTLPNHASAYRLGANLRLVGYDARLAQGQQAVDLNLYWQALAPETQDYTVFVHVLDASGQPVAQRDGPPVNGWYPSSAWLPGQIIADHRQVPLPATAAPGDLHAAVGLYTPADGRRAPVYAEQNGRPAARQPDDEIMVSIEQAAQ